MPTCLVVDDSRIVRQFVVNILEKYQITTTEAVNGAEALEKCRAEMPDIIVLDWNMPVLDGISFLRQLRQSQSGHHPKVLFCTTESAFEQIETAMIAGANEYIMKPFDEDILASKLRLINAI